MGKYIPESPVFPENSGIQMYLTMKSSATVVKKDAWKRKHQVQLFIEY